MNELVTPPRGNFATQREVVVTDVHLGNCVLWKNERGTLVCDIDGTIADLTHRRVYVATKPKNWAAFERTMHLDAPIQPIIDVVRELHAAGWTVVMCSGRGSQNRDVTERWLAEHGVPYHALYMRRAKDYRRDSIVKAELLEAMRADGHEPSVVFDDRNQVVEMWREAGILCVQVAPGDF